MTPGLYLTRLLCPWDSPGKKTGMSSHSLSQGISPTQGLDLSFQNCRQILYHLSYQRSPNWCSLFDIFYPSKSYSTFNLNIVIFNQFIVSIGKGNGSPFQYSCLENSMDIRAWWATVLGVAKSWT